MPRSTPGYRELILADVGDVGEEALAEIEEIMRANNGGVLDHLDRGRFRREAKLSKLVWAEMRRKAPCR